MILNNIKRGYYMLNFLIKSNTNHSEVEFETNELKILLGVMEHQKEICSKLEQHNYEVLYNKIKALYLFDRLPDEQSVKQINHILLPSNNVTEDNIHSMEIEQLQFYGTIKKSDLSVKFIQNMPTIMI